jgi:translocation and assembly module TamB
MLGLNLTLSAPGKVFVRGRGLDAELAGRITLAGSTAAPSLTGRFTLRQGTFNLVGQTLTFSSGEVGFDGSRGFDPTLDFVATSSTASVTATLTISGAASAPKIVLSSVPELPQDEILAQLLFHQGTSGLTGVQLAEAAAALAQISGVDAGFDPLNAVRRRLGLDRLSLASSASNSGAALQAGRYIASGIYVGATQNTSGGGTQATLQIDLTRRLKLQATAGPASPPSATGATAADQPTGTGIGLSYQFDY